MKRGREDENGITGVTLPMIIVDAFTSKPFAGNPAAVCILKNGEKLNDQTMQNIAAEMNLSETAFVAPKSPNTFSLRWFTPTTEVNLCGHATLATAHALINHASDLISDKSAPMNFDTLSGTLIVRNLSNGKLQLDFPEGDPKSISKDDESIFLASLAKELTLPSQQDIKEIHFCLKTKKMVVRVSSTELIPKLKPTSSKLMEINYGKIPVRGMIVTALSDSTNVNEQFKQYDFISRYFSPWNGIDEDPVTGSAHTVLARYWSPILGKTEMKAFQASKRGGEMDINLSNGRVLMSGTAVSVLVGSFHA